MMGRKRVLRPTSTVRYEGKMEKSFEQRMPPNEARSRAMNAKFNWIAGISLYHNEWNRIEGMLIKNNIKIPPFQKGLYRAFFNELMKNSFKGMDRIDKRKEIIDKWSDPKRGGLKRDILEAIADLVWPQRKPKDATKT
jgi:hypothetical protein